MPFLGLTCFHRILRNLFVTWEIDFSEGHLSVVSSFTFLSAILERTLEKDESFEQIYS